jgi:hypothetical protein
MQTTYQLIGLPDKCSLSTGAKQRFYIRGEVVLAEVGYVQVMYRLRGEHVTSFMGKLYYPQLRCTSLLPSQICESGCMRRGIFNCRRGLRVIALKFN